MGQVEILVLALSCLVVPMQALCPMEQALLRELVMEEPACPDQEAGLALWSDPASWGGVLPASGDVVTIDKAVKLDVPKVEVKLINIVGNGKLVFSDTIDIDIETEGIMVQDSASLILGSDTCRFQHDVHILFKGIRTADRSKLGDKGEKYIVVKDNANLQLHGKKVLPWTKLSETVERFDAFYGDSDMVMYSHKMSEYAKKGSAAQGPALYIFSQDFKAKFYKAYDFDKGGSEADEQKQVDNMLKELKSVQDGDIVAIAKQNCYETKATITELNKKLVELTGVADVEQIATLKKCDAYSLVFQKGGEYDLKIDRKIGKNIQDALATIISNNRKVTAVSHVDDSIDGGSSKVDFRILSLELGSPIINVVHDLTTSSWKVGDELLLTSTDYDMNHAEVRAIKEIILPHTIRLSGEMEYRHFGKIEDNIDMRGEVAHLNRNIKFEGEVQDYCPDSNSNCGDTEGLYNFDTYGAHIKILHGFGGVFFQGVELTRFGQLQDKGHYPIHFHVCGFVGDKEAIARNNVIKHSFARAVVVHGTYGTSLESPGVIVEDNVAFDIYGMTYFVEDGAERGTIFRGNLGAGVKIANNGFTEDLVKPSVFWWTTPEVSLINNVAAGSEGRGFWMSLPKAVVGPSAALGVYAEDEAIHTPIWPIDNNVAHSNWKGGFHIEGLLLDENGTTTHEMNYAPRENPLDSHSPGVKVQIVRLTVYKNFKSNLWAEAGAFEVMQLSSAESQIGVQINRAALYSQFLKKSIFVGRSKENYEEEGEYPDAAKIKRYIGWIIWDGPTLVKQAWFDGFGKDPKGKYVGGAIGYVPKTPYPSSALCNFTELRFGYEDKVNSKGGNRVFLGNTDDKKYGYKEYKDGDESETFIDGDGSLTKCPQDENWDHPLAIVRPEKFAITANCQKRENWKMFVCDEKLGKIRVQVDEDFHRANKDDFNDATQAVRRNRKDETDVAYEDHTGEKDIDYVAVLKSDKYYYAVQWLLDFPKKSKLRGYAVEQNYSVVVGLCLPENIDYSDIDIFARREGQYNTNNDDFIHATSIDEVFDDVTMSTVFLENRILYMNIINERTRKAPWTSLLVDECPGNRWQCSYFTVDLLVDDIQGYKPCFNPTKEELSTDNELGNPAYKSMECDLPAGQPPEKDWGAGDFYKTAVDGQWSDWLEWSPCCPATNQTRGRYCDNPPPFGDGLYCVGPDTETRDCVEIC